VATVEAVIAIVFFVLLYWSVIYVGRLNEARAAALVEVRGCAWTIAARGCGDIPDRCKGSDVAQLEQNPEQKEKFDPVHQAADEGEEKSALDAESQSALTTEIDGLLFERLQAKSERVIERPPLYGGDTVNVGAHYTLPCNSRPGDFMDQVERIWNAAIQ
jgi:hypothetical protein